nr:DHH family phosphoesterase [Chloroflexia bacterium]
MNLRWIEPAPPPSHLPPLHPDPLLHALLARRVSTPAEAADFLDRSQRPLPDPFALPGMAAAVTRLRCAIEAGETVAVFGDYDADGITSAAIATLALRAASAGALPVLVELPKRTDGYGLNPDAICRFAADGASLLLALDCGSSDHDALALARSLGLDAIVVDHHELHGPPPANATFVSARLDPASPYRGLSAAGLALLLATGLARSGLDVGDGPGCDPVGLADLAMIGIVADVSDLRGVARTIVRDGLRRARTAPRPGLTALLRGMDLDPAKLDSRQVARRVGPALNAPGRRADPTPAFDLLLAGSALGANGYVAEVLAALEWARAERTRHAGEQAARFRASPGWEGRRVAVLAADDCPSGITGSVASHLAADLARPVIVLGRHGDHLRGSARSAGGFDIGSALQG